ncbi:MAG: hypothetical protein JWM68_1539 [Verrucomicrobiales bacterium]|nr:hypothetical protein [Verrucomicrobiales bacterium]
MKKKVRVLTCIRPVIGDIVQITVVTEPKNSFKSYP